MKRTPLEVVVEDYLVERVEATGGEIRKVVYPGRRGAPDRFAFWAKSKKHAFVECKRPGITRADPHQEREIKKLKAAGIDVWLISSKEAVDIFVDRMAH